MRVAGCVAVALIVAGCGRQPAAPAAARLAAPPKAPYLMLISVAPDDSFHHVAIADPVQPSGPIYVTPLVCERAYSTGSRGVCLTSTAEGRETRWFADLFDERFERYGRVALTGNPSRVRLSPAGRFAAATVFESGHAYDEHGFSTRTSIVDTASAQSLGDLEQFTTIRDGRVVKEADFNFWGVTFARDEDTFFATLQTASVSYLVKGSVAKRTAVVLRPGVECPSLSPDNTRIAFKKRVGTQARGWWQLAVLRLDTLEDALIGTESRSVDDQVEWIDDHRIAYHLTGDGTAADLWAVDVSGAAPPQLLRPAAYSPATVGYTSHSK